MELHLKQIKQDHKSAENMRSTENVEQKQQENVVTIESNLEGAEEFDEDSNNTENDVDNENLNPFSFQNK